MGVLKGSILNRSSHTGEGFKTQRREMIEKWLREHNIKNYTINDDFTIDVNNYSVSFYNQTLEEFPEYIQFGVVGGYFDCSLCHLISLRGVPRIVDGYFDCSKNDLTSLEGAPKKCHNFYCYSNYLTSLKGSPEIVGSFDCRWNKLTSLEGAPKEILGDFNCLDNQLTSLKGAPKKVGYFDCSYNKLTSLEGVPREVGGFFRYVSDNVQFTEEDVRKVCKVKGEIMYY